MTVLEEENTLSKLKVFLLYLLYTFTDTILKMRPRIWMLTQISRGWSWRSTRARAILALAMIIAIFDLGSR